MLFAPPSTEMIFPPLQRGLARCAGPSQPQSTIPGEMHCPVTATAPKNTSTAVFPREGFTDQVPAVHPTAVTLAGSDTGWQ